jgi:hypothetical protein
MTAIIFLRKSYQLAQTKEHLHYIATEDLGARDGPGNTGHVLDDLDEAGAAALAKYTVMPPSSTATAPLTPAYTPERTHHPKGKPDAEGESESWNPDLVGGVAGRIPGWDGLFWRRYGNRTRVGPFGFILYMPKMAGEN